MDVNYLAVALATLAQFAIGGAWYMGAFSKIWGEIHGFDKLSKKEQDAARSQMMPEMTGQMAVTALAAFGLAKIYSMLPNESIYNLALILWLGFIVPTQFSAIVFGGTDKKWVPKKFAIMSLGSLACILVGGLVIQAIQK